MKRRLPLMLLFCAFVACKSPSEQNIVASEAFLDAVEANVVAQIRTGRTTAEFTENSREMFIIALDVERTRVETMRRSIR